MRPDTLPIRDRLLAVLREQGPLSTKQACEEAGTWRYTTQHQAWHHDNTIGRDWGDLVCDGTWDTYDLPLTVGQRGYRELAALTRQGKVRRVPRPGQLEVWWEYVPDPDLDMSAFEEQMQGMI